MLQFGGPGHRFQQSSRARGRNATAVGLHVIETRCRIVQLGDRDKLEDFWGTLATVVQTVCAVLAVLLAIIEVGPIVRRLVKRVRGYRPRGGQVPLHESGSQPVPTSSTQQPLSRADIGVTKLPRRVWVWLWVGYFSILCAVMFLFVGGVERGDGYGYGMYNHLWALLIAAILATRPAKTADWLTAILGVLAAGAATAPMLPLVVQTYIPVDLGVQCITLFAIAVASRFRYSPLATGGTFAAAAVLAAVHDDNSQVLMCLISALAFAACRPHHWRTWIWVPAATVGAFILLVTYLDGPSRYGAWTTYASEFDPYRWQAASYRALASTSQLFGPSRADVDSYDETTTGWLAFLAHTAGIVPAVVVLTLLVGVLSIAAVLAFRHRKDRAQLAALAFVPVILLILNILVVAGLIPTIEVSPPPFNGAFGAVWLAVMIAATRAPIFTEQPINLIELLRHPVVYLGFASDSVEGADTAPEPSAD